MDGNQGKAHRLGDSEPKHRFGMALLESILHQPARIRRPHLGEEELRVGGVGDEQGADVLVGFETGVGGDAARGRDGIGSVSHQGGGIHAIDEFEGLRLSGWNGEE